MMMNDYDGQMIFGYLVVLKLPDIGLTGEEKTEKPHQEACPDRGSNLGPLRDKHACYRLFRSDGLFFKSFKGLPSENFLVEKLFCLSKMLLLF